MQKVYLLLRSNKQTGPYSLEELLQLNLKPFDLVWMEGRSAAWQYPSEIPTLKPYVPETPHADAPFKPIATSAMEETPALTSNPTTYSEPQNPIPQKPEIPKRVFVTVPKNYAAATEQNSYAQPGSSIEHRAYMPQASEPRYERTEEVKQAVPSYSQSYAQQKPLEEEAHTNYSRSLNEVEEEYTNWMYRQKTKKKSAVNPKDLVLAVLIPAVIGAGYFIMAKPSVTNSVLPGNQKTAQITNQPAETTTVGPEKENATPVGNTVSSTSTSSSKPLKNNKKKNPVSVSKRQTNASVPSSKNPIPVEKTIPNIQTKNGAVANTPEVKQQPKTENTPTGKKKKLGDVLKNIFAKKDKKEEPKNNEVVLEDPKPADNRQAQRRGNDETSANDQPSEKTSEINTAALADQIDVYTNNNDNWMMGVKNLKVTLRNRSNVTIQTASVSVSYYNENNELLEKKLIYFSNVAPRTKAIVTAPDNKWADHVDLKLAAVSAKDDRYAKY